MSKFCSQQLPVCKVIPPSGYGSRKAALLSSALMGWITRFLFVSLLSMLLGLTWYQPVLADVISCQPEIVACPDSYLLKPLCDKFGVGHVSNGGGGQFCLNSTTGKTSLEGCYEACKCPLISDDQFGDKCVTDDPTVNIYLEMEKECNELGGHGGRTFLDVGGPTCMLFVTSQEPKKLGLIDPACSAQTTCKGDFLKETGESVAIDESKLLTASVTRSGVVTDGVTQLLLRVKNNKSVTFTLGGNDSCQFGTLMQRDGSSTSCNSLTAEPVKIGEDSYVFATYRAPLNFPPDSSIPAKVSLEAKSASGEVLDTTNLQLEPPPVILVHGVWDGPSTIWKNFSNSLEKERYTVYFVAHNSGEFPAAGTFDPLSTNSVAIPQLITKTQEALKNLRTHEIAASQVDIVAHSMGGLIARATVKTQNYGYQYNRMDNYKKGDFHKIITIGTPHQGTRIADVLVNGKCHSKMICTPHVEQKCLSVLDKEICTPEIPKKCVSVSSTLEQILPKSLPFLGSHPLGPAVYGFQTGSTAIKNLGETPVPSHSIVAGAPTAPDEDVLEGGLNSLFDLFGLKAVGDKGNEDLRTIDDILGGDGQHDVIVPIESQRGGLTDTATTLTNQRMTHLAEPASNEVHNRVLELLRQSPDDLSVFSHFTALQGGKSNLNFADDQNRCQATTNTKSSLRDTASDAVISFEPQIGTVVTPGQQVKFLFDIQGGSVQKSVLFTIGDDFYVVKGAPPYTLDYTVPANTGSKISIYALTASSDPNTEAYAVESYLTVKLPDTATTGTTETVPARSCGNTNETSYTVPLDRSGFYIIETTLPPDQRPGVWSLLIDSMSRAPLRSKTIGIPYAGGLHGGVVLKEKGLSSSWIGFSLAWPESVKIKATDSLKNLSSFKLEVVKQTEKGWASVYGPVDAISEQVHSTNRLDAGFFAVVVTSKPDAPRGQLGISIDGQSLWGAVTGGWIDHTGVSYSAFFVGEPKQTADLKLLFCGSYGTGGAGEPTVQMLYQKEDGSREVYWHAK